NAVTLDIPEHGAACKVFRRSPHEAWRVLRTSRRAGGKDANRFASTELVPGGYVTSACSPLVYTANRFPESYQGSVFVCDPANNLILRDVLVPHGATFVARRGHADSEFLSSTDNWFRPVHLTLGPDGAIYVLDFYREVIETPLSLEDDIKRRVNLQSRERGRIWRITAGPAERRGFQPGFDPKDTDRLVLALNDANSWTRLTAQRLLVERKDRAALPALEKLAATGTSPGRIHALRTLSAFGALRPEQVVTALQDEQPGLREQALQLAEPYLASSEPVRRAALALVKDPSPRVRFQLAFSLGELDSAESATTLAEIASRPDSDSWTQTAVLSSASRCASRLLQLLTATDKPSSARLNLLRQVARLVGTTGTDTEIASAFQVMGTFAGNDLSGQLTLLDGLGQGLAASGRPLAPLWDRPPAELAQPVAKARRLFEQARNIARDEQQPLDRRVQAIRLLGRGPFSLLEEIAPALLEPRSAPEVQMAAVRALAEQDRSEVSRRLLDAWSSASPSLRREMAEALLGRRDRVNALLSALESKQVLPAQMDPAVITRLRQYSDPGIRNRMAKLRAGQPDVARAKVVQEYQGALDLPGDVARGKSVFQKHCAACHRLENVGTQVGADLLAGLRNKTPSTLLVDILDPGREVDPRFTTYVVTTTRGQVFSGIIASESATSLTLKRGEGAEDTVLRTQIERTESTGKSLMPEGLEAQISRQNMADLIAYLMKQGASR
ncbi:MAG: c-type cytochrome, partial [Gemmataceae bacterium]